MTGFNEMCHKFQSDIRINHVYRISGGAVKYAKQKNGVDNEFEISLNQHSEIEQVEDTGMVWCGVVWCD